eukprot:CAMPEP_0201591058 /NCGR_PEP_ID=MMETSP0190_2-20130828/184945_1 /ASSEMBLY_ACC=CAM_ASM_000263 /TAXON_ID=37353 /ORGANISM="Rosalina sp." /LENGTH=45 /DNA_ID= /DNA_START= /DNA_END= /DNA_ORIENTATION=
MSIPGTVTANTGAPSENAQNNGSAIFDEVSTVVLKANDMAERNMK